MDMSQYHTYNVLKGARPVFKVEKKSKVIFFQRRRVPSPAAVHAFSRGGMNINMTHKWSRVKQSSIYILILLFIAVDLGKVS